MYLRRAILGNEKKIPITYISDTVATYLFYTLERLVATNDDKIKWLERFSSQVNFSIDLSNNGFKKKHLGLIANRISEL